MLEIRIFQTAVGKQPFLEWQNKLDGQADAKVTTRLNRLRLGNFGDCKIIGDGVSELRIDYGPGYRLYFGRYSSMIIVLLIGGDKSSQRRDINQAKRYWSEYKERISQ